MLNVNEWMEVKGEKILREIGLKEGQIILDFGCGSGNYDILASRIIGNSGKIYALDSDEEGLLEQLIDRIKRGNIKNIEIIKTSGEIELPLDDSSVDVVLIYDILHLLNDDEREELFREFYRILRKKGFVSYHATHLGRPSGKYSINLEEINRTLDKIGFILHKKFKKPMFHWAWIEESNIFNYKKKSN